MVENVIITDGLSMIAYLDRKFAEVIASNKMVTGIVIGSKSRKLLTEACQKTMGMALKVEETVNRFHGALLIEDGNNPERLEVISGVHITVPIERSPITLRR